MTEIAHDRSGDATEWKAVLSGARRDTALTIAYDVAGRLVDDSRIAQALASGQRLRYSDSDSWRPYSVCTGDAGISLMCSYVNRCLPGQGWDGIGHRLLVSAAESVPRSPAMTPGLFTGLSGLAFTVAAASENGSRYQRLADSIDRALVAQVDVALGGLRSYEAGMPVGAFDVVSGLSGIAACLLARDPMGLLPAVLDGLVWLTGSEGSTPRWMTPSEYQVDERLLDLFPGGALNCGLAHGIPGPLAALSTAMSLGSRVAGHAAAVRSAAQWLADRRFEDAWGLNWPSAVAAYPDASTSAWDAMPSRASWCYGAPGVARSLWLAGQALDDDGLRDTAVCAMSAVLGRPIHAWGIDSPAFCHGLSGVLQVVLRFAVDTGAPQFIEGASHLVDRLIGCYSPDRPLGFASPEPPDNTLVDRPGLLEGAPGVVLALLAAATDIEPSWDRLFLLS